MLLCGTCVCAGVRLQAAAGIQATRCTRAQLLMHQLMARQLGRCGKAAPESAETGDGGSGWSVSRIRMAVVLAGMENFRGERTCLDSVRG